MIIQHARLIARLTRRFLALAGLAAVSGCAIPGPAASDGDLAARIPRHELRLTAGYALSYLIAGDPEGQPVIFVHGTPGDAGAWNDYLINVPKGYRYIAIDRPGFGDSGPDGAEVSLAAQGTAIAELIRALGARPAALVGHSLGGPIIAQAAVDHPSLIAGIVIVAGSLDPALEDVPFIQFVGDTWPFSALLPRALRNTNREILALKPQLEALGPRLATLKSPLTVVHGTKDELVPFANVAYIRTHMTQVRAMEVTVIRDQNHFLPWNSKKEVDAAIMKLFAMMHQPAAAALK